MGIPHYLAMTAAELSLAGPVENTAFMACHFSAYRSGLSNLPAALPSGAILILDDSTPIENHAPEEVCAALWQRMEALECRALLLDFQRPDIPEARQMAEYLTKQIPFPAAVSHLYAAGLSCPVFLPPVPLHTSVEAWAAPWKGREIWLETALEEALLTLTPEGCTLSVLHERPAEGFAEEKLHCHYRIETEENAVRFSLWRTEDDLRALLEDAERYGVAIAMGLWQELHT